MRRYPTEVVVGVNRSVVAQDVDGGGDGDGVPEIKALVTRLRQSA